MPAICGYTGCWNIGGGAGGAEVGNAGGALKSYLMPRLDRGMLLFAIRFGLFGYYSILYALSC